MQAGLALHALVIADDDGAATTLAVLLKRCGHLAYLATSGEAALEKAPRLKPDVVFIDLATRAPNDLSLAHQFRGMPELASTSLIAVADTADEDVRARASADGFDGFLSKPYSLVDLSQTLARVRQKIESSRALAVKMCQAATEARRKTAATRQALDDYWGLRDGRESPPRVSFLGCNADLVKAAGERLPVERATTASFDTEEQWLAELDGQPLPGRQCVVIDMTANLANQIDALALLAKLSCRTAPMPVVALVAPGDVRSAVQLMRGGAFEVIEMVGDEQELVEAILLAIEDREAAGPLVRSAGDLSLGMFELSDAERQLLQLTVAGVVNKQIARQMVVSLRTVHIRRSALMKKLGARTRADLIRLALQSGLCE
jgi:FixJ family two-component response regulator